MISPLKYLFCILCFLSQSLVAFSAEPADWRKEPRCIEAVQFIKSLAEPVAQIEEIETAFQNAFASLENRAWAASFCNAVFENATDKQGSKNEGATFSQKQLAQTAMQYEAFRLNAFKSSGVSPKRFFGFLDEQGKSAAQEKQLKDIATRSAKLLNDYGVKNRINVNVTPKEIIVTHLAEGGAKLLTTDFDKVDIVDPVFGVGLDDFRIGFKVYPGLIQDIDRTFGTQLESLSNTWPDSGHMNFTESVLGTAVMYFYEKDLAQQKLAEKGRPGLETRALDEQFIVASLVYNSGILFDEERFSMIKTFATADYLFDVSEKTAARLVDRRPRLPVMNAALNDALLQSGKPLPKQFTHWSAVFHILQRYGAWVALTRFSDHFDGQGYVLR
jgi:hypothetical protein